MILTFGQLEDIIKNKNITFVRSFKDDLINLCWEYFSIDEIIKYYGVNNLKEFEVLLVGKLNNV